MANEKKKSIKLNKNQTISLYKSKEQELQQISNKLREIDNLLTEISKAKRTLDSITKINNKENILVNVGAGVLVDCKIENTKDVKITLPGNIIIDKDIPSVLKDVEKREKELASLKKRFNESYQNSLKTLRSISTALSKMSSQNTDNQEKNIVN